LSSNYVYLKRIDVIDAKYFTEEVTEKWKDNILDSYDDVFHALKAIIDPVSPIKFYISKSLIEEVIVDAVIGLQKITNSTVHHVTFPNTFKIAAYLSYWWLRHKPVSIHYPNDYFLEYVQIKGTEGMDEACAEEVRQKAIWRLKHINELVAVQLVMTLIFRFDEVVCNDKECKRIQKLNPDSSFTNFEEMKDVIFQKLIYYLAYRPIAPKVIEHILEGYTFHPAWGLTGAQWTVADQL